MLLALWADFWNLADWVPQPPPVIVVPPTTGGHRHRKGGARADVEWWDEYEKLLRRLHPVEVREDAPVSVQRKAAEANRLIEKVKTHTPPSLEAVQKVGARIVELTSQIEAFELQSRDEEEAILALLL